MIKLILSIFTMVLVSIVFSSGSNAVSSSIMIVRLQASGMTTNTTGYEAVEIKNNSNQSIDVTGWCLSNTVKEIACIAAQDSSTRLDLLPGESALFMTTILEESTKTTLVIPEYKSDFILLSDGISTSSGTIQLLDTDKKVIDEVRWGGDSTTAPKLENAKMLQRSSDSDTDVNAVDFQKITTDLSLYRRGGLVERVLVIDTCPNLPDTQSSIPIGYMADNDGNCYEDSCDNISGLQKVVPNGYAQNGLDCEASKLSVTEILPNVIGADTGNEFIELYNPNSFPINLEGYYFQIDMNSDKHYTLPNTTIAAGEYVAFTDVQLGITLPNTTATLKVFTPLNTLVDQSVPYSTPEDDESWAVIDGEWQYTSHPTPGSQNIKSLIDTPIDEPSEVVALVCPAGKYRNPETNRCKTLEIDDIKPCAVDQIRNPETNRCRSLLSVATGGLTACKVGQERNPETNRCRSVASTASATLKPCPANQERNPETNRCRKSLNTAAVAQFSSVKDHDAPQKSSQYSWWLAGASLAGFGGYALWEWRVESTAFIRRMFGGFGKSPSSD